MRLDTARRFALSLPETTEEPHFDLSSFRVKGKIFATVPPGGKLLHLSVDPDEALALLAQGDGAFEEIVWGKQRQLDWIRVHLAAAQRDQVCELLEDGWRRKAPKRVVAAYDTRPR
jgi:hypothetical protein